MSDSTQTRHLYDRISRAYDVIADPSERDIRELGIQALAVTVGDAVLEIGCGTGHGVVSLARAVGQSGHVYGVDMSSGMIAVAAHRIRAARLPNVSLAMGDARQLAFRSSIFDAVFMSFTLELFESAMPHVLAEVRRVLRPTGRVGVVAMAETGHSNTMTHLYGWVHHHWPHLVDCKAIDVVGALKAARFAAAVAAAETIWGLPVVAAVGVKATRYPTFR